MDRKDYLLRGVNVEGVGLEIGPFMNGVCTKRDGYNIEILDSKSLEEWVEICKTTKCYTQELINRIELVDYVWHGEPYTELIKKERYYDYIIASHVIEHIVDLIDFFSECSKILKNDGTLCLAIPDKRYEFDMFREVTSIRTVIDKHLYGNHEIHSEGVIADSMLNYIGFMKDSDPLITEDCLICPDNLRYTPNFETVRERIKKFNKSYYNGEYHSWVFTPVSFQILIYELFYLGYIDFKVVNCHKEPCTNEFLVQMKKFSEKDNIDETYLKNLHIERCKEDYFRWDLELALKEKMEEIKSKSGNIYIYGAGNYGCKAASILEYYSIDYKGFIVTFNKNSEKYLDHQVYLLKETQLAADDLVIIAVSKDFFPEIVRELKKIDFNNWIEI